MRPMIRVAMAALLTMQLAACAPAGDSSAGGGGAPGEAGGGQVAQGTPMLHDEKHISQDGTPVQDATPAPAPTQPYDAMFLDMMVDHHRQALTMAEEVLDQGSDEQIAALARKIQQDQQKEIAQMEAWRKAWYPDLPRMTASQIAEHMEMDMPGGAEIAGLDPDHRFLVQMIPHHEAAVMMGEEALGKAEHAELKKMAQSIVGEQQKEIAQMQKMLEQESAAR